MTYPTNFRTLPLLLVICCFICFSFTSSNVFSQSPKYPPKKTTTIDPNVLKHYKDFKVPTKVYQIPGLKLHSKCEQFHPHSHNRRTASIITTLPGQQRSKRVSVEVIDGYVIAEGDIILGREVSFFGENAATRPNSASTDFQWDNGIIPYTIEADHPDRATILNAIQHVNDNTNICVTPRDGETHFVRFVTGSGCASNVGCQRQGPQDIVIGGCSFGSTVHEIAHAAGLWHEQSRVDRDNYITINEDNIEDGRESNFQTYAERGRNGEDFSYYDYGSIMHYPATAFNIGTSITIESKIPGKTFGQRNALSAGDIRAINSLYTGAAGCSGATGTAADPCVSVRPSSFAGANYNGTSATLTMAPDGTVTRSNIINPTRGLTQWIVKYDRRRVAAINASGRMTYRYTGGAGGIYEIYLEQFIDGAYRRISNIVSYQNLCGSASTGTAGLTVLSNPSSPRHYGGTTSVQLNVEADGTFFWGAITNDNRTGTSIVIEKDGRVVMKHNARDKTSYLYFVKTPGTYKAWIEQSIGGRYQVISNVVAYRRN